MSGSKEIRRKKRAFDKLFEPDDDSHITAVQIRELMPEEFMSKVPVNGMGVFLMSFLGNDINYLKHSGRYILRGYKVIEVESEEEDTTDNAEIERLRAELLETQNNLADMTRRESNAQKQLAKVQKQLETALTDASRDRELNRVLTERFEALSGEIANNQRVIVESIRQAISEATDDIKKDIKDDIKKNVESLRGSIIKFDVDNEGRITKLVSLQNEHLAKVVEAIKPTKKVRDESPPKPVPKKAPPRFGRPAPKVIQQHSDNE